MGLLALVQIVNQRNRTGSNISPLLAFVYVNVAFLFNGEKMAHPVTSIEIAMIHGKIKMDLNPYN